MGEENECGLRLALVVGCWASDCSEMKAKKFRDVWPYIPSRFRKGSKNRRRSTSLISNR